MSHHSRSCVEIVALQLQSYACACLDRPDRPAFGLDRDDGGRLPMLTSDVREHIRHHLLAAQRHDKDGPDVGMRAIGGQRVMCHAHVGTQLAATGEVRQRGAGRAHGGRDPLGHDGCADHGRDHEQMIARAHAAVRPPVSEKSGSIAFRHLVNFQSTPRQTQCLTATPHVCPTSARRAGSPLRSPTNRRDHGCSQRCECARGRQAQCPLMRPRWDCRT